MSDSSSPKNENEQPWPNLPDPLQHRMSIKWTTLESVRILQQRLDNQDLPSSVMLLTPVGAIYGELTDISDSYEENLSVERADELDVASASVHLRTELWRMYAKKDPSLQPIDCGAIVHLQNASIRLGSRNLRLKHLALFASEIVGFSLVSDNPF